MTDIKTRIEHAMKVITGNEALLDMLDADGATALLDWGMQLAGQIAQSTEGVDDSASELDMEPRLKALRQFMRSVGNWAAGKYVDAASRAQLKVKLAEQLGTMHCANARLSASADLDNLLEQASPNGATQQQVIVQFKESLAKSSSAKHA